MGELLFSTVCSLDGFVADEDGRFDWAEPDRQLHAFVNEQERPVGTHLYGSRMYRTMSYWDTADAVPDRPDVEREYAAIWQAADKIVYSRTLDGIATARTRLEPVFDPQAVGRLKAESPGTLSVGGPTLAAQALAAGLVDEIGLFLMPVMVGGGTRALPDALRLRLELLDERRFTGGAVHVRYRVLG